VGRVLAAIVGTQALDVLARLVLGSRLEAREGSEDHEMPPPYSPQANGVAERINRTIVEGLISLSIRLPLSERRRWMCLPDSFSAAALKRGKAPKTSLLRARASTQSLAEHGIHHEMPPPYSPQANGVAERINRTIVEGLIWMCLPDSFSAAALKRWKAPKTSLLRARASTQSMREHGIHHEMPPPYSPQANGVAERINRTIVEGLISGCACPTRSRQPP
jgi:transposase InsO family protein